MNYPSAAGGLKMMFLAQILTIVGAVVTVVGAMLAVVTAGILSIVMLLGSLLVLAAGIHAALVSPAVLQAVEGISIFL